MKILIMCEGPNELKIVNLLLDNGKLKFTRDDLLDMRPFHARQLTSPQLKPALDAYHGDIAIYRIGDKMTDSLKIPKELLFNLKEMVSLLENLKLTNNKVLVCVNELTDNICLAARNLANVKIVLPSEVNTFDVVSCDNLLITEEALKSLEEVLK